MAHRFRVLLATIGLAACGGEVIQPASTTTTTSASTTSATTAVGGGGAGGAPVTECVPEPQGTGGVPLEPTCADLDVLTLTDPVVAYPEGAGALSLGEGAAVTVILREIAGKGFNWYPGVRFSSDTLEVVGDGQLYAVLPCQSVEMNTQIVFAHPVPAGAPVTLRAQVTMLSAECPDAPALDIPVKVQ